VRTGLAIFHRKRDRDHRISAVIHGGRPADAGLLCGACHLLRFPIDRKISGGKALAFFGLPMIIATYRPEQIKLIAPLASLAPARPKQSLLAKLHQERIEEKTLGIPVD
jgi:hypothetical protein